MEKDISSFATSGYSMTKKNLNCFLHSHNGEAFRPMNDHVIQRIRAPAKFIKHYCNVSSTTVLGRQIVSPYALATIARCSSNLYFEYFSCIFFGDFEFSLP
jgi:hypothetical protein